MISSSKGKQSFHAFTIAGMLKNMHHVCLTEFLSVFTSVNALGNTLDKHRTNKKAGLVFCLKGKNT